MSIYSDTTRQERIDEISLIEQAKKDWWNAGGVGRIKINDQDTTYRSIEEANMAIKSIEDEIMSLDGGLCTKFAKTRRLC